MVSDILRLAREIVADAPLFTGPMTSLDESNLREGLRRVGLKDGKIVRKFRDYFTFESLDGVQYRAYLTPTGKIQKGRAWRL